MAACRNLIIIRHVLARCGLVAAMLLLVATNGAARRDATCSAPPLPPPPFPRFHPLANCYLVYQVYCFHLDFVRTHSLSPLH